MNSHINFASYDADLVKLHTRANRLRSEAIAYGAKSVFRAIARAMRGLFRAAAIGKGRATAN